MISARPYQMFALAKEAVAPRVSRAKVARYSLRYPPFAVTTYPRYWGPPAWLVKAWLRVARRRWVPGRL